MAECPACGEPMTPENSVPAERPRKYAERVCADEDACYRRFRERKRRSP
jgi:hypothetical protein